MSYDVGLLLDGLILVFLSVTIFYAARLSLFLKSFREGRDGMQLLIRDLSDTVDKADQSIQTMKVHAQETEAELTSIINEAKFLSDELRFMNETGDSLADRLEKLANRNRELVDLMENAGGIGTPKLGDESKAPEKQDPWQTTKSVKDDIKSRLKSIAHELTSDDDDDDGFEINDFDINEDDEYDFHALDDGAYREEEAHRATVNTEAKSKVRSFAIFDRDYSEGQENLIKDDLALNEQDDSEEEQFHSRAEQDLYEALQRRKNMTSGKHRVSETS